MNPPTPSGWKSVPGDCDSRSERKRVSFVCVRTGGSPYASKLGRFAALGFLMLTAYIGPNAAFAMESPVPVWTQLPSLPDPEGFASAFAGVSHDALLVAGGANFPDKRPWDG